MTDIDREIAAALARIVAGIERRLAVPVRSRETIRRSVGQWAGARGRMWKSTKESK